MTDLEQSHRPENIRRRLDAGYRPSYVRDGVLGGIDGCVTTFALVAGVAGAGLSGVVALGLGLASLFADGFSMAVSNYQGVKSDRDALTRVRREEDRHVREVPEGEREEIRQIFARKGFEGDVLERIVQTITADQRLWVDTMLREEHGLDLDGPKPVVAGGVTFLAFVIVGAVPLIPFLLPALAAYQYFVLSTAMTVATFFAIGYVRGSLLDLPRWRAGVETLIIGSGAALLAYWIGTVFQPMIAQSAPV